MLGYTARVRRALTASLMTLALGCGGRVSSGTVPEDTAESTPADGAVFDLGPGDGTPPLQADLEIQPANTTLVIDRAGGGSKPAKQTFVSISHRDDGTTSDVTTETVFSLEDPTLGVFTGSSFTSVSTIPPYKGPHGVLVLVRGATPTRRGFAQLTLLQLDSAKDLYFLSPYNVSPTPLRGVLRAVAGSAPLDLSVVVSPEPNPEGVDGTQLVKSVRAMDEGDSKMGCAPRNAVDRDGDGIKETFPIVAPLSVVCFEIVPKMNTSIKPLDSMRFYPAHADVRGAPGEGTLERHLLLFGVPTTSLGAKP